MDRFGWSVLMLFEGGRFVGRSCRKRTWVVDLGRVFGVGRTDLSISHRYIENIESSGYLRPYRSR